MNPTIERELSQLDPAVPFRASTDHWHHTWAKTFYSRPELYIQPRSVAEIRKLVTLAQRCGRRLVVVGSGHSPSDLTCTSAWLVNLDGFAQVLDVSRKTGVVTVEAGIRLWHLGEELEEHGLMLSNLGSIDSQSIAGVIATGTHGSSLQHGLLSECILSLTLMLANGQLVRCSPEHNQALFRAALVSLGALGIVVEVTFQTESMYKVAWQQQRQPLSKVLTEWSRDLWTAHEFVRVWWLPYEKSAIVWHADKTTDLPEREPPKSFYGQALGYHIYHNLLALSNYFPRILPWVEWLVFGLQYGFKAESEVTEAVQPARKGLLMNCLYSQFVNEWALPLEKGPETIIRLSAWLHGDVETARIPFPVEGVWVHCPVEVRVTNSMLNEKPRPFLDPTCRDGPTLYFNATLYRPYLRDPPCRARYYEAFEWLMREMGAKPHWAKNFTVTGNHELHALYGADMDEWLKVRNEVDPDGMFLGEWHHRNLPLSTGSAHVGDVSNDALPLPLLERETIVRHVDVRGAGDGLEWIGDKRWQQKNPIALLSEKLGSCNGYGSSSATSASVSDESYDLLASVTSLPSEAHP